jgi:hypothetical protein
VYVDVIGFFKKLSEKGQQNPTLIFGHEGKYEKKK